MLLCGAAAVKLPQQGLARETGGNDWRAGDGLLAWSSRLCVEATIAHESGGDAWRAGKWPTCERATVCERKRGHNSGRATRDQPASDGQAVGERPANEGRAACG